MLGTKYEDFLKLGMKNKINIKFIYGINILVKKKYFPLYFYLLGNFLLKCQKQKTNFFKLRNEKNEFSINFIDGTNILVGKKITNAMT